MVMAQGWHKNKHNNQTVMAAVMAMAAATA
jgi:hypothetical protein